MVSTIKLGYSDQLGTGPFLFIILGFVLTVRFSRMFVNNRVLLTEFHLKVMLSSDLLPVLMGLRHVLKLKMPRGPHIDFERLKDNKGSS